MSWTPQQLGLDDFALLLTHFPFNRRISAIHIHQSGGPPHHRYRDAESIATLHREHVRDFGLQTMAQHMTIDPAGKLWLGRDWDLPPASVAGHNGNRSDGPFMLTLVGSFALGEDELGGSQAESLLQVVALLLRRFELPADVVRSSVELRGRSHLRLGWDIAKVRRDVAALRPDTKELEETKETKEGKESRSGKGGKEAKTGERAPLPAGTQALGRVLESIRQRGQWQADPLDAEIPEEREMSVWNVDGRWTAWASGGASGGNGFVNGAVDGDQARWFASRLNPDEIDSLRPHLINLNQGQFSTDGAMTSTREDVDAIFEEHLERAFTAAKARGQKLKVLFYAHGGLVDEGTALQQAARHIPNWKRNGIYPIYFIWETGLLETFGQLLRREERGARERPSDALVEWLARQAGGPRVWLGMKESAARASAAAQGGRPEGGARYAAQGLKRFCDAHPGQVELYAIGHSAGAIFHNEFVPAALELQVPAFEGVYLLAPAVTVDAFKQRLLPKMGNGIHHLDIFTLRKDLELRDDTSPLYNKSILYLIYEALEPSPRTPVLGLEIALRSDAALKQAFGLGNQAAKQGEVVWANTAVTSGRNATRARRHTEFGNDSVTLNSLARRVLGVLDEAEIEEFPETGHDRSAAWEDAWEGIGALSTGSASDSRDVRITAGPLRMRLDGGQGARRALCVGIDDYPNAQLRGCVADANLWADTLNRLGFETRRVTNQDATYAGIQRALSELISSSQAGDVLVFQFSGHGTLLPDASGDEVGGQTPESDQAICPFDFDQGTFLIDDDLATILAQTPEGVNLTCFIDCCYSGTISRFAVGSAPQAVSRAGDQRSRYLKPTDAMIAAHLRFRRGRGRRSLVGSSRGPATMREVVFSACQPDEVAWESNGQGDFTRQATRLLEQGALVISNEAFTDQVVAALGAMPRQRPMLDSSDQHRTLPLLYPFVGAPAGGLVAGNFQHNGHNGGPPNGRVPLAVTDAVGQLSAAVEQLRGALQQL